MTFVQSEAFSGSGALDPFNFRHFDLKTAKLIINSRAYPCSKEYEPVWDDNKNGFMREYLTLNTIGGQSNMCGITPYAYAHGRFFLVWNLCPDKNLDASAEIVRPGTMSLELTFAKNLTYSVHAIMYGVFDNTIEITHDKEVVRNWV